MEYWSLQDDHAIASIRCNDGTVIVGYLKFEDVYPLSHNSYTNNIVMMSFHISHLNDVITFLRNEKPLQLWFDDVKNGGRIQSISHGPVGELE